MRSCLYLKHMVSYTLPTHVTSDPSCTPQHAVMNAASSPEEDELLQLEDISSVVRSSREVYLEKKEKKTSNMRNKC